MSGPRFFQTGYGRRFFDSQLPRLIAALEGIERALTSKEDVASVALIEVADELADHINTGTVVAYSPDGEEDSGGDEAIDAFLMEFGTIARGEKE